MLATHDRYAYVPISNRKPYEWPNGARLAVAITLNVEQFPFGEGRCVQFIPGQPAPDVINYSWCDYGNRVGFWRLLELFDEFDLPVSMLLNTEVLDHCPQIPKAILERGDEIVCHGRTNADRQANMSEDEERRLIAEATEAITDCQGAPPRGWMGPGLSQSRVTPDLLQEAGYRYHMDWGCDDQPMWMKTRNGRILLIPYPKPTGDIAAAHVYHVTPSDYADMMIDQFDEMLHQSRNHALVYALSLHCYIVGHPFRIRHLRRILDHIRSNGDKVWLAHTGRIADHVIGLPSGVVP